MKKREILRYLRDARAAATFERIALSHPVSGPFGAAAEKFTQDVKAATHLYRETWILAQLDAAIRMIEEG